jgi:hypothetical protein
MAKILSPKDLDVKNPIAQVEPETRRKILAEYKDLSPKEKTSLIENLVESAMTLGITDAYAIRDWIGRAGFPMNSITAAKNRVLERWKEESNNISENIGRDRALLISAAWNEVRECERIYKDAQYIRNKVSVKKLKLEWLQFISKLSFVDKLIEANESPMNIIIHDSDVNMTPQKDAGD